MTTVGSATYGTKVHPFIAAGLSHYRASDDSIGWWQLPQRQCAPNLRESRDGFFMGMYQRHLPAAPQNDLLSLPLLGRSISLSHLSFLCHRVDILTARFQVKHHLVGIFPNLLRCRD